MARLTVRVGPLDGEALRKARTDSDLLIREVADRAGISRAYLGQLERGTRVYMSRPKFRRLAAVLGVEDHDSLVRPGELEGAPAETGNVEVPDLRNDERADTYDLPERLAASEVNRSAS